jgi:hypothetical protein
MIQIQHLWKLFHLEKELKELQHSIEKDKTKSTKESHRHKQLQEELKTSKKAYAKINKQSTLLEASLKDKEREKLDLVGRWVF